MDDRPVTFNRLFGPYGGALKRSDIDPPLATLLDDWHKNFDSILAADHQGPFPPGPIWLDYVDNSAINAIAVLDGTREFIGVFMGATAFVLHSFAALSMVPETFGGVGKVTLVPSIEEVREVLLTPTTHYLDFSGEADAVRIQLAQAATTIVQYFQFAHEVGHHVFGHLWYLTKHRGTSELAEAGDATSMPISASLAQERQVMEFDSDIHGAIVSLNWWMRSHSKWGALFGSIGPVDLHPFYVWAFATGSLFRFFDLNTRDSVADIIHPAPDLRFMNVYVTGVEEVRRRSPEEEPRFRAEAEKAMRDLESLWDLVRLPAPSFTEIRSRSLGERMATHREMWAALKDNDLDPSALDRAAAMRLARRAGGD